MSRPSDWWILDLGADPAPGEPANLLTTGSRFLDFADDARRARLAVDSLQGDGAVLTWIGQSGDVFREQFGELPDQLRKVDESHRTAGEALQAFAPKLQNAQAMADRALADGRIAREQLDGLAGRLNLAQGDMTAISRQAQSLQQGTDPDPEQVKQALRDSTAAQQRLADVQGKVASAEQALNAAKSLAEQARELRDGAARECRREIAEASDAGIQPRSFWEKLGDFFKGLWDIICEVAKWVALVAGIIAMIIGGPLAWIALAAGAILLIKAIVDYAQGKGSIADLIFGILGIIPGVRGLTSLGRLSALYKAGGLKAIGQAAMASMQQTLRGMAGALGHAAGGTVTVVKNLINKLSGKINDLPIRTSKRSIEIPACGDPVDISTGRVFMTETDLDLPGAPPLLLERTHRSDYRDGRSFGPSWASTLDQRVAVEPDAVHLFLADGALLTYPVPADGETVFPGHGRAVPLRRTANGFAVSDPAAGLTWLFELPEEPGAGHAPLTAVAGPDGGRIAIVRDDEGVPAEIRHPDGRRITVTSEDGLITALHLAPADGGEPVPLRTFSYADGHLTEVVNASGLPMRFTHDEDGRLIRWDDRNGMWYRYTYDDEGRCVLGEGRDGFFTYRFAYDAEQRLTRATDSLGHTTVFELNEDLQVVAETDPLGNTVRSEWDTQHRLLSRVDALGRTTGFRYGPDGELDTVVRPDGSQAAVIWSDGRITAVVVTDEDGGVWRRGYGPAESPDPYTEPLGVELLAGHREVAEEPVRPADDAAEPTTPAVPTALLIGATAPEVAVIGRDALGRPAALSEPVTLGWTTDGTQAWRDDAASGRTEWTYDGEGNEVTETDALGATTRTEYGPFDLPVATVSPSGARTVFTYDTELRLSGVTDPAGRQWHYRYDPAGRLVEEIDFDGRATRRTYDAAGRLIRTVNAADESVVVEYDVLGNVVRRHATSPDGESRTTTFRHDPVGRLTEATSPDATLTVTRDFFGRVTAETIDGRAVTFTYDDAGHAVHRGTPTGVGTRWSFDPSGTPAAVTMAGHELTLLHDEHGRHVGERLDASVTVAREYDAGDRLVGQRLAGGAAPEVHRTFGYRADGALTTVTDSRDGATAYRHDDEGRITGVDGPARREEYRYDPSGDVIGASGATVQGERAYQGTELVRAGQQTYRYDRAGRLAARQGPDGTWTYRWTADGHLHAVIAPDGGRWRYGYDALGRRVSTQRLTDGPADAPLDGPVLERTDFAWDGPVLVEESVSSGRVTTWQHDLDGLRPLLQYDGALQLLVCDPNGAPTDLVAADGTVTWRSSADLWGGQAGSAAGTVLRFPGQQADPESGLHYNVHRYYDPGTGRYLSPDPLGLGAGPSPVRYVDDPLLQSDPLGLMRCRRDAAERGEAQRAAREAADKANARGLASLRRTAAGAVTKPPTAGPSKPAKVLFNLAPDQRTIPKIRQALGNDPLITPRINKYTPGRFDNPQEVDKVLSGPGYGSTPEYSENWATEWLIRSERTPDVQAHLESLGVAKSGWIKGHLLNADLGGLGVTENLTPLTNKANAAFKNVIETRVKDSFTIFNQLKTTYRVQGDFTVKFNVRPSGTSMFPNSTDLGELSIRQFLEFDVQYLRNGVALTPAELAELNGRISGTSLKPLPPAGTTMNPLSGEFITPDLQIWKG
ncbi:DUF6531 domain-containing protein [Actinoplanes palleronii]|uniref:RHS repeat-associated protein n=1 Tax=Actinoplanes palleronii TaxID=113570 RepID=A0ABQ4BDI5_9ACTN|nr:DUF6531 domain-containing protein [Actinoplanes palleronii]GIE68748.1 hypothetical protein Apa02nite_048560 [Actinoplanes palleronii]